MPNENLEKGIYNLDNVSDQFNFYLEKSNLKQSEMSDIQFMETRRAFYAGFGQMAIMLTTKIADVSENEGIKILDGFLSEISDFYGKETNI